MQLRTTHATIIVIIWQSNALRAYPRPQTSFCHKKKSETEEGFQTEHDKLWPLLSLSDHSSRLESRLGHIGRTLEHIPTSAVKSQQLLSIATAWSMQLKTTHATVIIQRSIPMSPEVILPHKEMGDWRSSSVLAVFTQPSVGQAMPRPRLSIFFSKPPTSETSF